MNFCKDCKWCEKSPLGSDLWKCNSPNNEATTDLVSGEKVYTMSFCSNHRTSHYMGCGPEGKWFVAAS